MSNGFKLRWKYWMVCQWLVECLSDSLMRRIFILPNGGNIRLRLCGDFPGLFDYLDYTQSLNLNEWLKWDSSKGFGA